MWDFFDFNGNGLTIEDLAWYFTFIATILIPAFAILYRKSIASWIKSARNRKQNRRAEVITAVVAPLIEGAVSTLHDEIRNEVREATRQIQPDSNGGVSLPDLHSKMDVVIGQQELILDNQEQLSEGLRDERQRMDSHLTYHISNNK